MASAVQKFWGAFVITLLAISGAIAAPAEHASITSPNETIPPGDDEVPALRYIEPLAEKGDPAAQSLLGLMYYYGDGVPQDFIKASDWFRHSAEQGHAFAQASLGWMYAQGEGVAKDFQAAAKWFRLSADQGNSLAQFKLGVLYFQGQGVPQDYGQAQRWFRLSAEQGDAHAQGNLGLMYADGLGVPRDYIKAHMWLNLATARFGVDEKVNIETAAKKRDRVAARMSPAQIAEAQRLAREWRPK